MYISLRCKQKVVVPYMLGILRKILVSYILGIHMAGVYLFGVI